MILRFAIVMFAVMIGIVSGERRAEAQLLASENEPQSINPNCLDGKKEKAGLVTHYFVPLLQDYDHFLCHILEGTCIYMKDGVPWLHNYGYEDEPLADARCKNGYGNRENCLHPCRALAASMKHHTWGEVIFFKNLVGMKCGNKERDGFEMIHDGYMVVIDTGSPKYFNKRVRFDFFLGRCGNFNNGECFEGGPQITTALSNSDYCVVWDPKKPNRNKSLKDNFVKKVKREAIERQDYEAAVDFEL